MIRNVLPKMISVSRNCGFTTQLNTIFNEKLDNTDLEVLSRWLQIVEDETRMKVNKAKKDGRGW